MAMVGVPGEPPPLFRMPIADMYAGIHGVAAVCAALFGRATTGKGQHVDTALYDCMVGMHDFAVQCYTLSRRQGAAGADRARPAAVDGLRRVPGARRQPGHRGAGRRRVEAPRRRLIGGDALAADTRFHQPEGRNANRVEILGMVKAWTKARSVKECTAALDAAEVPCAPVQNIDAVLADPQIAARGMIVEQDHPVLGKVRLANVPFKFSDCDVTPRTVAPLMGQHNREIAAKLGFSKADIDAMVKDGVLYAEEAVARLATA